MNKMVEQKYLVVRAKAPRKRKFERFEVKYHGTDPKAALDDFIAKYRLRDVQSAVIIPYLIDDSISGLTMRTLLPSGQGEKII